jgi:hypothetical protein
LGLCIPYRSVTMAGVVIDLLQCFGFGSDGLKDLDDAVQQSYLTGELVPDVVRDVPDGTGSVAVLMRALIAAIFCR